MQKKIKDTFSIDVTAYQVTKFLESENMKIKKLTLIPYDNSNTTKNMRANFVAIAKPDNKFKSIKFIAHFNNYSFRIEELSNSNSKLNIELNREWQRYLMKIFGKDYLDYHEYRTDEEIKYLKTHKEEILKQKEKEIENTISRLKSERVL